MQLPSLHEKNGALAIVEPSLMASQLVGKMLGRWKYCKVKNFKFCIFDFYIAY